MKKGNQKKLVLNKSTVTRLTDGELKNVKGGTIFTVECMTGTLTLLTTVITN